jgi:hypothetical protein
VYSGTEGSYSDSNLKIHIEQKHHKRSTKYCFEIAELVRDYIRYHIQWNDYLSHSQSG